MKNKKVNNSAESIFSDQQKINFFSSKNPFDTSLPEMTNDINFFNDIKPLDGSKLNNSDRELIQNHLEKYLPSDSLRLEIQIQRISKQIEASNREIQCLSLLKDSQNVNTQKKSLQEKIDLLTHQLNTYKEQYKNISSIHNIAITLRDGIKNNVDLATTIKKSIYGKKAKYLETFQNANESISLLSSKLVNLQDLPDKPETESTIIDILNNYNKIVINTEKAKKEYFNSQPKDIFQLIKTKFQQLYYGYEIPEKY